MQDKWSLDLITSVDTKFRPTCLALVAEKASIQPSSTDIAVKEAASGTHMDNSSDEDTVKNDTNVCDEERSRSENPKTKKIKKPKDGQKSEEKVSKGMYNVRKS